MTEKSAKMIVVKMGGSLFGTPELGQWLHVLAQATHHQPIVIVPGGGPFADQVRQAQQLHRVDDHTAHHMALLAMKQFGLLLCGMHVACQSFECLNSPPACGLSVWLPDDPILSQPELPHSWEITADSIALWLTQHLQAQALILVKRCHTHTTSITALCKAQILDTGFASRFRAQPIQARIMHYQHAARFTDKIDDLTSCLTLP